MKENQKYIIPFVGLKIGKHTFEYSITDSFFELFEYSTVQKGKVKVELLFEKKETMMIGNFTIQGIVETTCDRCNDIMDVEIEGEYQLIYKFDDKESDDESLIIVYPEEYEIDIKNSLLELISVSIPTLHKHPDGKCNEEMISILDEYLLVSDDELYEDSDTSTEKNTDEDDIDPRWKALKNLSKDK